MKIFISGELDLNKENREKFLNLRHEINNKLNELLVNNEYGGEIKDINIVPIIFSQKTYQALPYKERKIYSHKTRTADLRLIIDHTKFINSNYESKKRLIIENILDSLRILKSKVKRDYNGDKLENDIIKLFNIS